MRDRDPSKASIGPLAKMNGYHDDLRDVKFSRMNETKTAEVIDNKALIKAKAAANKLNKKPDKESKRERELLGNSLDPKTRTGEEADGRTDKGHTEFGHNDPYTGMPKNAEATILSDPKANPIKILKFVTERWTDDWIDWEPETILQTAALENIDINRVNQDKLMALKVVMKTTEFFDSWRVFEKVCLSLSNHIVHWGHPQPVRVHEMAAVVALVTKYFISTDFSDDVKNYIAASAVRDGFIILPAELKFSDFEFSKVLLENGGDEAADAQKELIEKIKSKSNEVSEADGIQLMRIIRVQHHVSEYMNEAT